MEQVCHEQLPTGLASAVLPASSEIGADQEEELRGSDFLPSHVKEEHDADSDAPAVPISRGRTSALHVKLAAPFATPLPSECLVETDELLSIGDGGATPKFSLDEKLPKGPVFQALTRIRATINSYTLKVTMPGWFASVKVPTLQALERRLNNHAHQVVGVVDPDVELGFIALQSRIQILLSVWKSVKKWHDSQKNTALAEVYKTMVLLRPFLEASGAKFAPDLLNLFAHSSFQLAVEEDRPISETLRQFDPSDIVSITEVKEERVEDPPEEPDVSSSHLEGGKLDVKREPEMHKEDDAAMDSDGAAASSSSKKRRRSAHACPCDIAKQIHMSLSPREQLGFIIAEAIKAKMSNFTKLHEDPDGLKLWVDDLSGTAEVWQAKAPSVSGDSNFGTILAALEQIFRCGLGPGLRPKPSEVREARRTIYNGTKSGTIYANLCKGMIMYAGCKPFTSMSHQFATSGLQDDAATSAYNAAKQHFVDSIAPVFDNADQWFDGDGAHPALTVVAYEELARSGAAFCGEMSACIGRWTAASLEVFSEDVLANLLNAIEIAWCGNAIMCRETMSLLASRHCVAQIGAYSVKTSGATAADDDQLPQAEVEATQARAANKQRVEPATEVKEEPEAAGERDLAARGGIQPFVPGVAFMELIRGIARATRESLNTCKHVCNSLASQRGQDWFAQHTPPELSVPHMICNVDYNEEKLSALVQYTTAVDYLSACEPPTNRAGVSGAEPGPESPYTKALHDFASVHNEWKRCGFPTFKTEGIASSMEQLGVDVQMLARHICETNGAKLYAAHVQLGQLKWIEDIMSSDLNLSLIAPELVSSVPLNSLLSKLFGGAVGQEHKPNDFPSSVQAHQGPP